MRKRTIVILSVVWMVILVAGVSSAVTMAICGALPGQGAEGSARRVTVTGGEYATISRYDRLESVRETLMSEYVTELDEDKLLLGAVRGMMESVGDAYTFYYTPEEMLAMTEHTQGLYEGLGMLLSADKTGRVAVLRVFRDSPAYEGGILPGDYVMSINGEKVSAENAKQLDEAIGIIRNAEEPLVELSIQREKEILNIGLTRSTIQIRRVEYEMLPGDIGYILLYEFMGDDVSGFRRAVSALKAQDAKGLIIDLRSNPGGLLKDVVEIADLLLPSGLVVYTEDRSGKRNEYYSDAESWDIPMAVLIDGMSASASEILAGALQDYGRATIVGQKSYGKGIVQTVIPFRSDGAGLQLTTAYYYTPKGRNIHGKGITPDVFVEGSGESSMIYLKADPAKDAQLRRAYDIVLGGA